MIFLPRTLIPGFSPAIVWSTSQAPWVPFPSTYISNSIRSAGSFILITGWTCCRALSWRLCVSLRAGSFSSRGQSIRAHDKEPRQEFFKLSGTSMPSTHSGTKGKWCPGHGLRRPVSQKTGVQILFVLSPYMSLPYPVNSDPTSKSPENGFISFCSHYMRIWVSNYGCLWRICGVIMTDHTCCGFRRSFIMRIHHLPLFSGSLFWELAQFWKLIKRWWILIEAIVYYLLSIHPCLLLLYMTEQYPCLLTIYTAAGNNKLSSPYP